MPIACLIRKAAYYDSVTLMQLARALRESPGVQDAAVVMGTPANQAILADAGLLTPEAEAASSSDLVIAISAADEAALQAAMAQADALLARRPSAAPADEANRPPTLAAAIRQTPDANLALISVPGQYAAQEARWALEHRGYQAGVQFNPYGEEKNQNYPGALVKIIALEQKFLEPSNGETTDKGSEFSI